MDLGRVQLAEQLVYSRRCQLCKLLLVLSKLNGQVTWRALNPIILRTQSVESGKNDMEDDLYKCMEQAKLGDQQWKNAQESLHSLEKSNVASMNEIVRREMGNNELLRGRFISAVSSTFEDADIGSKNLLSSVDRSLQLDREACTNLDSMIVTCCGDLRQLNSGHHHKIVEITENAGKCLIEDYAVGVSHMRSCCLTNLENKITGMNPQPSTEQNRYAWKVYVA